MGEELPQDRQEESMDLVIRNSRGHMVGLHPGLCGEWVVQEQDSVPARTYCLPTVHEIPRDRSLHRYIEALTAQEPDPGRAEVREGDDQAQRDDRRFS